MDDEAILKKIESMSKRIDAEADALAINDDLMAAMRRLDAEEDLLKQRYANRELTKDEYFTLWHALMDRTPHEVILTSIKFSQAMTAALILFHGVCDIVETAASHQG
jgi:uncharacterized protein YhaN